MKIIINEMISNSNNENNEMKIMITWNEKRKMNEIIMDEWNENEIIMKKAKIIMKIMNNNDMNNKWTMKWRNVNEWWWIMKWNE